MLILLLLFPIAYLLGSLPSSVWLGRALRGLDLRDHGSGNAGATNAFRVLGKGIGTAVLFLDMGKGYAAVSLSGLQSVWTGDSEEEMILRIILGLVAVGGHVFPVFAGFRGVATMAGVGLALHPLAALAAMVVYLLVFLLTKISALGSLLAVLSYPLWVIWVFPATHFSMKGFSILVMILVIITHRSNLRRLIRGEEKALFRSG